MAQSFGVPSRNCSVAEFDALRAAGQVEAAWKGYCDCMFVEVAEVTDFMSGGSAVIRCINGACVNQNDGTPLPGVTPETAAGFVQDYCRQRGGAYSINVYPLARATPEWTKCMSNYCLAPGGCPNPTVPSLVMPFNADPGSALSPWTDVGAAARMIPKRSAGFFYDVTAFFHIDLAAYEPLKLWQTFWTNPFLFGILMTKIQLIPLAGAVYATGLTFTGPPIFLIPGALQSATAQGKDPVKEVFEVAGIGLIEQAKFLAAYVGKCGFGIPGACGVAMAVQKAAQDQIDSGEINNVASKEAKAIIIFLASNGSALVDDVMNLISNPERGFTFVFQTLQGGFESVARMLGDGPETAVMKKTCEIVATIFGIAGIIAKGIDSRTDAMMVADNVADYLLGFRPSEYFALIKAGKKESALDSAKASMATKGTTVESMIERAGAIVDVLDKVISELSKIAQKIGGAFDDVLGVLNGIRADIGGATAAVVDVGHEIDAVTRQALGLPATVQPSTSIASGWGQKTVLPSKFVLRTILSEVVPAAPGGVTRPGGAVLTAGTRAVFEARQRSIGRAVAIESRPPPMGAEITNIIIPQQESGAAGLAVAALFAAKLFL
jgi:hypothetical protein